MLASELLLFARQPDEKSFVARNGDNITLVLKRNGLEGSSYFNQFIELNRSNLGRNNTLLVGVRYKLPPVKGGQATVVAASGLVGSVVVEPILGKENEKVTVIDDKLKGAIFYLDSGHGGPDPGAIGNIGGNRLCEDEYAYDVTLRLGRELIKHGARVNFIIHDPNDGIRNEKYLKSDKDEVCFPNQSIPLNQVARLKQRVDAANKLYKSDPAGSYRRCIVIHVDARHNNKNIDIFFYHHQGSKYGALLANSMRNTIEKKYSIHQPGRGYAGDVSYRELYQLKQTQPVTVFIELGNINHSRDQQRLIVDSNRQALANWMCEGIIDDYQQVKK